MTKKERINRLNLIKRNYSINDLSTDFGAISVSLNNYVKEMYEINEVPDKIVEALDNFQKRMSQASYYLKITINEIIEEIDKNA